MIFFPISFLSLYKDRLKKYHNITSLTKIPKDLNLCYRIWLSHNAKPLRLNDSSYLNDNLVEILVILVCILFAILRIKLQSYHADFSLFQLLYKVSNFDLWSLKEEEWIHSPYSRNESYSVLQWRKIENVP